jgi:hypothetical protein
MFERFGMPIGPNTLVNNRCWWRASDDGLTYNGWDATLGYLGELEMVCIMISRACDTDIFALYLNVTAHFSVKGRLMVSWASAKGRYWRQHWPLGSNISPRKYATSEVLSLYRVPIRITPLLAKDEYSK